MFQKIKEKNQNVKNKLNLENPENFKKWVNLFLGHEKFISEDYDKTMRDVEIGKSISRDIYSYTRVLAISAVTSTLSPKYVDLYVKLNEGKTIEASVNGETLSYDLSNKDAIHTLNKYVGSFLGNALKNEYNYENAILNVSNLSKNAISNNKKPSALDLIIYEILDFKETVIYS